MFGRSVDVSTDRSALDGLDGSHCAVEGWRGRGAGGGGARGLAARGERVVCGCLQRRTEHSRAVSYPVLLCGYMLPNCSYPGRYPAAPLPLPLLLPRTTPRPV